MAVLFVLHLLNLWLLIKLYYNRHFGILMWPLTPLSLNFIMVALFTGQLFKWTFSAKTINMQKKYFHLIFILNQKKNKYKEIIASISIFLITLRLTDFICIKKKISQILAFAHWYGFVLVKYTNLHEYLNNKII